MESPLSKFRGCMMGSLIGDCLGRPFEGIFPAKTFAHLEKIKRLQSKETEVYTDDTALTWALAESLISCKKYDAKHMASRFTKTFFDSPNRGYGMNVGFVFMKLKEGLCDVYQPAREQFKGRGSYGNGSAMRIAPVALCFAYDYEKMLEVAKDSSLLTHMHRNGYNGALLQCVAVWLALKQDPKKELDVHKFVDELIRVMDYIETVDKNISKEEASSHAYTEKLKVVKSFLSRDDVSIDDIIINLGHSISAEKSVATAIYAFLKTTKPIDVFPIANPFERAVAYAVNFGGDADTIASMAGSIAGAYYGIEEIPKYLQDCCEGNQNALKLADALHALANEGLNASK